MSLREYNRKRKFDSTPEPRGKAARRSGDLRFVVQLHRATRLHFDFRIEIDGSYKSWAVPRGPSLNPMDQRLAVFVEDHPIAYGSFEGIIPRGNYGAGTVMIWDQGTYRERGCLEEKSSRESERAMLKGLDEGHMTFVLEGEKLRGEFALLRLDRRNERGDERSWLLVKKRDEHSTYKISSDDEHRSVVSGRTIAEIAEQSEKKGDIWLPKRTVAPAPKPLRSKAATQSPTKLVSKPAATKNGSDPMLRRLKPMLARVAQSAFEQDGWLYCELTGGLRAIAEIENKRVSLHSKSLLSFSRKFPKLIDALSHMGDAQKLQAVVDGEVASDGALYRIFDLLYLNGHDLRELPLRERLEKLSKLKLSGNGIEVCKHTTAPNSPHSLARNTESVYSSGVSPNWIEVRASERTLRKAVAPAKRAIPAAPIQRAPTPAPRPAPRLAKPSARGPIFSHLNKLYWKHEGLTKGHLIDYYRQVAPILLPHLHGRPMSLHRFPGGIESKGFYQKDFTGYKPRFIETYRVFSESAGKSVDYVTCQNEETLLYLANLGCIEMNPWLSRTDSLERPDWLVIDIDPDQHGFDEVVDVTLEVRRVLDRIGVESLCKTSGATGMHVCVPLGAQVEYEIARTFAENVCQQVQLKMPRITTLERNPARRGGRMYLDFMQNRIGQTLASPYSVRPRAGAPVSTPLRWSEVTRKLDPGAFTLHNTPRRLDRVGDLWKPLLQKKVDPSLLKMNE